MPTPDQWQPSQAQLAHLENLFIRLNMPRAGQQFVRDALANAPSREVNNQRSNSIVKFNSLKNHRVMGLESRTGEYPQAILLESESDVVMWLCQAPKETINVFDEHGKRVGNVGYHLDFLVVREESIEAIEVRDEGALFRKSEKSPHQFWFDTSTDQWHFRPAEEHFKAMGIDFRVVANRQINSVYVNNLRYLEDFLVHRKDTTDPEVLKRLQDLLKDVKRLEFTDALRADFTADQLLCAIAFRHVYVDLQTDRLDTPQACALYASEKLREAYRLRELQNLEPLQPVPGSMFLRGGAKIVFAGKRYEVMFCTEREVLVRDERAQVHTLNLDMLKSLYDQGKLEVDGLMPHEGPRELSQCSEQELDLAMQRLQALRRRDTSRFSTRSLSRFAGAIRGLDGDLAQLLALVDNTAHRGNRLPRYSAADEAMVTRAMSEKYNRGETCNKVAAYKHYLELVSTNNKEDRSSKPVQQISYTTFCRRAEIYKDVRAREGKRVAYQQGPIIPTAHDFFPVHGVMPHEVCYIDHTVLNVATISGDGSQVPLQKPFITIAIDGCTTQARALILTYDPPSATTVLLVLRDYVRRFKRLPKVISLDNGKEFRGKQLQRFCALYGITLRFRSPGEPRGGAPIESHIGAVEAEIVTQLTGNTVQMKDPRLTTKSVNGFNHAQHTLTSVYRIIEEYLFRERELRTHPVLGLSPSEFEKQRLELTGQREHVYIRYDENLMLATSPFSKKVMHKVCPRRGVWVNHIWYQHPALRGLPKGTTVRVRVEPFAVRLIYVEVKNRWHAAVGRSARDLDGRTVREVQIAVRAKAKQAGIQARAERLNNIGNGQPRSFRPEDFDIRLTLQQAEIKYLLNNCRLLGALNPSHEGASNEEEIDISRGPQLPPERVEAHAAWEMEPELLLQAQSTPANDVTAVLAPASSFIGHRGDDIDHAAQSCDGLF